MATPSGRVFLRFYAELNDHLPPAEQYRTIERTFVVPGTVKDLIESCGVPHTEVEMVTANGESVDFAYRYGDGDRIAVYPVFEAMDVTPALRLRGAPLRETKFVLDVHLGKLAAYLRMLGFDTFYRNCLDDEDLAEVSADEHRILLTRDRGLLKRGSVTHGYWLRETDSRKQAAEIVGRFQLARTIRPFTRCMACNGELVEVPKSQVIDRLPPRTTELYNKFRECPRCRRVYWRGSHYRRMERWIAELAGAPLKTSD